MATKYWTTEDFGRRKLEDLLTDIGATDTAEKVRSLSWHVNLEPGESAELGTNLSLQLESLKNGLFSNNSDKLAHGRTLQQELKEVKTSLLELHKDVTSRSTGLISNITKHIQDHTKGLTDFHKSLHDAVSGSGKTGEIVASDITNAINALPANLQDLVKLNNTSGELEFAGRKVAKLTTITINGNQVAGLDSKGAKELLDTLGSRIQDYSKEAGSRATELVKEMTEGLKKRAQAIENVQHEVATLSGAPVRGKMMGAIESAITHGAENAAEHGNVHLPAGEAGWMTGAGVGAVAGAGAYHLMGGEDKSGMGYLVSAGIGGGAGAFVQKVLLGATHAGKEAAALLEHVPVSAVTRAL